MPLTTKYEICPDHIIPVAQKQPTFCDATVPLVSPRNDFLRNERRNSILMTRHYPYLGSASDWSCGKCASANQKRYPDLGSVNVISMEFVHSILRRYYAKCRLFSQASDPAAQRLYVLPFQAYEQPVLPVSTKRF